MKNFIKENWYKLMIGTSLFIASIAFFIQSIYPAIASSSTSSISNYKMVPINQDGSISVRLTDEQLDKIIPKNSDGSINIRFSDKQIKELSSSAYGDIIDINITKIAGENVAYCKDGPNGSVSLGVCN